MHRLENCRNEYRLARARVYSRLRALASYIDYIFPSEDNIASSQGLSTRVLLNASIGGIDVLADEMNDLRRQISQTGKNVSSLQIRMTQMIKAQELHWRRDACQKEQREGRRFDKALKIWQARSKQWQHSGGDSLKRGLLISHQTILSDRQRRRRRTGALAGGEQFAATTQQSNEKVLTIARSRNWPSRPC